MWYRMEFRAYKGVHGALVYFRQRKKSIHLLCNFVCTYNCSKTAESMLVVHKVGRKLKTIHLMGFQTVCTQKAACHAFWMFVCWVNIKINWTYNEVFVIICIYLEYRTNDACRQPMRLLLFLIFTNNLILIQLKCIFT